jgi:hypothetical protein
MAALVGITPNLAAILAAQAPLQFMDRRQLWSADDVKRDRLVRVAAETTDLQVGIAGVQHLAQSGRRLRRALECEHPLVPSLARQTVGLFPRLGGALGRGSDGGAIDCLSRFCAHGGTSKLHRSDRANHQSVAAPDDREPPLVVGVTLTVRRCHRLSFVVTQFCQRVRPPAPLRNGAELAALILNEVHRSEGGEGLDGLGHVVDEGRRRR